MCTENRRDISRSSLFTRAENVIVIIALLYSNDAQIDPHDLSGRFARNLMEMNSPM